MFGKPSALSVVSLRRSDEIACKELIESGKQVENLKRTAFRAWARKEKSPMK